MTTAELVILIAFVSVLAFVAGYCAAVAAGVFKDHEHEAEVAQLVAANAKLADQLRERNRYVIALGGRAEAIAMCRTRG